MVHTPGFYVAHHPYFAHGLEGASLHKVGHTGSLECRLQDSAYATCFPPPAFVYLFTYETATKDDAFRLEQGVLSCAAGRRQGGTELVLAGAAELRALAVAVAGALQIAGTPRDGPCYPRLARPRADGAADSADGPDGAALLSPADLLALGAVAALPAGRDAELDALADGLACLGLGGAADTAPATPATPAAAPAAPAADAAADDEEDALIEAGRVDPAMLVEEATGAQHQYAPLEAREYQDSAAAACLAELAAAGRCILSMACRTGKTRVADQVSRQYCAGGGKVLFLVPGLALLRQTVQKVDGYGGPPREVLLVGSDSRPLPPLATLVPVGGQTTDPAEVAAACARAGPLVVFSTYQSSALLPLDAFALTVFDETHRVCGGLQARPFNHVLLRHAAGHRLFMTATPNNTAAGINMRDQALFGGVAYKYSLQEAIAAAIVQEFHLVLVGGETMAARVHAAMATPGVDKMLVYCRSIAAAEELQAQVGLLAAGAYRCLCAHSRLDHGRVAAQIQELCAPGRAVMFNVRLFTEGIEIPALNAVFFASPKQSPCDIIQAMSRPLTRVAGKPAARVFVPVEVDLAVPLADPANLKRFAALVPVFDALIAEDSRLFDWVLAPDCSDYAVEWIDSAAILGGGGPGGLRYQPAAMLAAARRAVRYGGGASCATERLLRAAAIPWPVGFTELRRITVELGRYPKTVDGYDVHSEAGGAKPARMNFHRFWMYARTNYRKYLDGEPQALAPYQLRDLETLPGWLTYGLDGPYPEAECLATLGQLLADNRGVLPLIEVNKGGWIGLDATPLERLSGFLTLINQHDGKSRKGADGERVPGSGFQVGADLQGKMDALCALHKIRWRKARHPPAAGSAYSVGEFTKMDAAHSYTGPRTFIQEAFHRFKALNKAEGPKCAQIQAGWPDYPMKHNKQENLAVLANPDILLPPKFRRRRQPAPRRRVAAAADAADAAAEAADAEAEAAADAEP